MGNLRRTPLVLEGLGAASVDLRAFLVGAFIAGLGIFAKLSGATDGTAGGRYRGCWEQWRRAKAKEDVENKVRRDEEMTVEGDEFVGFGVS